MAVLIESTAGVPPLPAGGRVLKDEPHRRRHAVFGDFRQGIMDEMDAFESGAVALNGEPGRVGAYR